jgi:hypothetical protein
MLQLTSSSGTAEDQSGFMPALIPLLLGRDSLMKCRYALLAAAMTCFSFSMALADDADELDATMRLMDDAEAQLPEAVTKPIQLPEHLRNDSVAAGKSESGHQTANAARNDEHRQSGIDNATEARERAHGMSEEAKENRANLGRSEDRQDPPDRPDPPNPNGPPE